MHFLFIFTPDSAEAQLKLHVLDDFDVGSVCF